MTRRLLVNVVGIQASPNWQRPRLLVRVQSLSQRDQYGVHRARDKEAEQLHRPEPLVSLGAHREIRGEHYKHQSENHPEGGRKLKRAYTGGNCGAGFSGRLRRCEVGEHGSHRLRSTVAGI